MKLKHMAQNSEISEGGEEPHRFPFSFDLKLHCPILIPYPRILNFLKVESNHIFLRNLLVSIDNYDVKTKSVIQVVIFLNLEFFIYC